MRDLPSLYQSEDLPIFLQSNWSYSLTLIGFMPKCMRFVRKMRANFVNPSEEQLEKFAKHLLVSFYMEHGDVDRVDEDLEGLLTKG